MLPEIIYPPTPETIYPDFRMLKIGEFFSTLKGGVFLKTSVDTAHCLEPMKISCSIDQGTNSPFNGHFNVKPLRVRIEIQP